MIIGLGHQAQVGKDTAARILVEKHGFERVAFADLLKEIAYDLNPIIAPLGIVRLQDIVDQDGWEFAKSEYFEVRKLLQELGVSVRFHLGDNAWVQPVERKFMANPEGRFVVTDVRFPNEFQMIRRNKGILVKMTREDRRSNAGSHVSETLLEDAAWNKVIANDGTVLELEERLIEELMFP